MDNAKEYTNKIILKIIFTRKMIYKNFSTSLYNPQNNGVAEGFNISISSYAKSILYSS